MQPANRPKTVSAILRVLGYPLRRVWRAFRYLDGGHLRGHPELEFFPTEEHRRQAVRRTMYRINFRRPYFKAVAAAIVLALTITLVLRTALSGIGLPISQTMLDRILVVPAIVPSVFFAIWLLKRRVSELLRHELLDCGVPICVTCGYPLIGLPGPNCPECGRPFDEKVREILDTDADPSVSEETI